VPAGDVAVCDGFEKLGLPIEAEDELVLTVKLVDCEGLDPTELSTVLVDSELETRLVLTLVAALDPGAGSWPGNTDTEDCSSELPDPITQVGDTRVELSD